MIEMKNTQKVYREFRQKINSQLNDSSRSPYSQNSNSRYEGMTTHMTYQTTQASQTTNKRAVESNLLKQKKETPSRPAVNNRYGDQPNAPRRQKRRNNSFQKFLSFFSNSSFTSNRSQSKSNSEKSRSDSKKVKRIRI